MQTTGAAAATKRFTVRVTPSVRKPGAPYGYDLVNAVNASSGKTVVDATAHRGYVLQYRDGLVDVYDTTTGEPVETITGLPDYATGIAVDSTTGKLYVSGGKKVAVVDTRGTGADRNKVTTVEVPGNVNTGSLRALAVDEQSHTVYVADFYGGKLHVYDGALGATPSTLAINADATPSDLAIDQRRGLLYVVDTSLMTDNPTTYLRKFDLRANNAASLVMSSRDVYVSGLTIDEEAYKVWFSSTKDTSVWQIDPTRTPTSPGGNVVTSTLNSGSAPNGITVDPSTGKLLVADTKLNKVWAVDTANPNNRGTALEGPDPLTYVIRVAADPSAGTVLGGTNKGSVFLMADRPRFTTEELPLATAGAELKASVAPTSRAGDRAPAARYSLVSGELPAGVTLSADGSLSGTPTAEGRFDFVVQSDRVLGSQEKFVLEVEKAAPAVTSLSAPATSVVYGKAATVTVRVAPQANGTLRAVVGSRTITAPVSNGSARIVLPAASLQPGTRTVALAFTGAEGFTNSNGTLRVTVAKAKGSVKVTATKKVKRGKAVTATVRVTAPGLAAAAVNGKVTIQVGATKKSAVVKKGVAVVKLTVKKNQKPGTVKVTATWAGSATVSGGKATADVKVTR